MTFGTEPVEIERPDWVILGAKLVDGGVMVAASTSLSHAAVDSRTRWEDVDPHRPWLATMGVTVINLRATMDQLVVVKGVDYADALRRLFEIWAPDEQPLPALPGLGPKVIEG